MGFPATGGGKIRAQTRKDYSDSCRAGSRITEISVNSGWGLRQRGTTSYAGDPSLGRFPGEGNGNPLQYSCLENPMVIETWLVTVRGVEKSQT